MSGDALNGGCQHICVNTPGAFHCECRPGYQGIDEDSVTCEGECIPAWFLDFGRAFISVPWKTAGHNDHIQPQSAVLCHGNAVQDLILMHWRGIVM